MGHRLGIDLGTTTVKVCLLSETNEIITSSKSPHNAYKDNSSSKLYREQDPQLIFDTLHQCLQNLDIHGISPISGIEAVSVTGQMHGVVLWKEKNLAVSDVAEDVVDNKSEAEGRGHLQRSDGCNEGTLLDLFSNKIESNSNLITWEDQRCTDDFLKGLPTSSFGSISTGYGAATLLWLHQHSRSFLESFTKCGTIMDLLVWLLARDNQVYMTPHNAKSWGYFDDTEMCWENEK